jgi:hypothetical protein
VGVVRCVRIAVLVVVVVAPQTVLAIAAQAAQLAVVVGGGVEGVELVDHVACLGQLVEIDLAAPDQLEHDLAELGERVGATAARAEVVEARSPFAGASLEGVASAGCERVAHGAGLLEGGP